MDIDEDISQAVSVLRQGGIILYPTDTVWGLGCDATDAKAVARLYALKGRADAKASLSLVDGPDMLGRFVDTVPEAAAMILENADSPVTIIYDSPRGIAESLLADDGSAAFRITDERYSRELCRRLGRPVVSTSANKAGCPTPADFSSIDPEIALRADYVASYRRDDTSGAKPSSIIKVSDDNTFKIIRS